MCQQNIFLPSYTDLHHQFLSLLRKTNHSITCRKKKEKKSIVCASKNKIESSCMSICSL